MYNLYKKDIGRERQATKCQRTLGKDNPECGKVSSDMTYFIDHDNYHKPKSNTNAPMNLIRIHRVISI